MPRAKVADPPELPADEAEALKEAGEEASLGRPEPDADGVAWRGASALRPFLVAIADLEPFPGNPRRGNVDKVRESVREFGQTRPVLSDVAMPNRVVAGNHFVLAAQEEGYTHVAVIPNEFENADKARAFMLADNRTHDLGFGYDYELLYGHVEHLSQIEGGLAGTGYADADVEELRKQHEALNAQALAPEEFPAVDPSTLATDYRCPSCSYEWSGNPAPGKDGDPAPAE